MKKYEFNDNFSYGSTYIIYFLEPGVKTYFSSFDYNGKLYVTCYLTHAFYFNSRESALDVCNFIKNKFDLDFSIEVL